MKDNKNVLILLKDKVLARKTHHNFRKIADFIVKYHNCTKLLGLSWNPLLQQYSDVVNSVSVKNDKTRDQK